MIVTQPITSNFGALDQKGFARHGLEVLNLGQRIDAVVVSNTRHGFVTLKIGDTVIHASTNIALNKNAHLLLEVVQKQPQLLLRLVPLSPGDAAAKPLQSAMISLLPQQIGLAASLAGLVQRNMQASRFADTTQLRSAVLALSKAIPERSRLIQAEGVRQAIQQSGLFLESLLARSPRKARVDSSRDLKACLVRVRDGLMRYLSRTGRDISLVNTAVPHWFNAVKPPRQRALPLPQASVPVISNSQESDLDGIISDLLTRTNGAAARLGLHQAITAENFSHGEVLWQLELPVKHGDSIEVVSVSIEKEQKRNRDKDADCWVVNLALELPELGPVHIRISQFEQGVSAGFWADSDSSRSVIEGRLDRLKPNLQKLGVGSLSLFCQSGTPSSLDSTDTHTPNLDLSV